jgi:hypothetical protein
VPCYRSSRYGTIWHKFLQNYPNLSPHPILHQIRAHFARADPLFILRHFFKRSMILSFFLIQTFKFYPFSHSYLIFFFKFIKEYLVADRYKKCTKLSALQRKFKTGFHIVSLPVCVRAWENQRCKNNQGDGLIKVHIFPTVAGCPCPSPFLPVSAMGAIKIKWEGMPRPKFCRLSKTG